MAETVKEPKPFSATAKDIAQRFFRNENAVLIVVLIALIGGMSVMTKGLTTTRVNMMNILLQSSIRGVAAIGELFVVLSAGIDLSVGGIGLFCAVLGGSMMSQVPHLNIIGYPVSIFAAIPIMLLAGAGWGIINGSLVSRLGVPALIATLGMWEISTGASYELCKGCTMHELPDNLAFFGQGVIAGVPVPVIIFMVVAAIGYFVLYYTTFGRSIYATGGNPVSAWLSGIRVKNIQFLVYIIAGFLAGLAGIIMTSRVMSSSMRTLAGLELDAIASVFIGGVSLMGGKGSLIGVVIGVLIIGIINNGMSVLRASSATQGIAKGAIIITAVAIDMWRRRG